MRIYNHCIKERPGNLSHSLGLQFPESLLLLSFPKIKIFLNPSFTGMLPYSTQGEPCSWQSKLCPYRNSWSCSQKGIFPCIRGSKTQSKYNIVQLHTNLKRCSPMLLHMTSSLGNNSRACS